LTMFRRLVLFVAFTVSSSSAFCTVRVVGNGAVVKSIQNRPKILNHHLLGSSSHRKKEGWKLWDVPNGGSNESDDALQVAANGSAATKTQINEQDKLTFSKAGYLLKTFWSMAFPYYQESQPGRRLFYGMLLLTLVNSGVSVGFSYISKDFWNALSDKDSAEFYTMMLKFGGALVVGAPVAVLYRYQREQLAVHWREWMTDRVLQLWNNNRVYYAIERDTVSEGSAEGMEANWDNDESATQTARIDNPDQRITEDVRSFTAFSLQLFITIATSLIDLVSFSLILYSIQPQLFPTIICYAAFGTATSTYIGSSLLPLNFEKLRREADLRYLLVRIRENAESIAFYGGEDVEGKEVASRLSDVVDNRRDINKAQRNLEFFTTCYGYFVQIVPIAVVAPQYFAGTIKLGVISQSVGAFNHILNDLTLIVNQFEQLSTFSAGIERLSTFLVAMRKADSTRNNEDGLLSLPIETNITVVEFETAAAPSLAPEEIKITFVKDSDVLLSAHQFSLVTPDHKRELISKMDLTVKEGENLLITGASGCGKSSMLRAIAGLWTAGSGTIERPPDDEIYFLPQRPFCTLGSLKDQLLYPSIEANDESNYPDGHRMSRSHLLRESLTDEEFLFVLEKVDLKELPYRFGNGDPIAGLNTVIDWTNTLSLGEQQRLAFGRVLVNEPRLVILDEATSALDVASEAQMYSLLHDMGRKMLNGSNLSRPGLTFISVGHRPTLLTYHDVKLRLNGGAKYDIEQIEKGLSLPDLSQIQGL